MSSVNDQNLKFKRRGIVIPKEPLSNLIPQQNIVIQSEEQNEKKKNQKSSEEVVEQNNQEIVNTADVNAQQPIELETEKQPVETETPAEETVPQETTQPEE